MRKEILQKFYGFIIHRAVPQHLAPLNEQQVGAALINEFWVMRDQKQAPIKCD